MLDSGVVSSLPLGSFPSSRLYKLCRHRTKLYILASPHFHSVPSEKLQAAVQQPRKPIVCGSCRRGCDWQNADKACMLFGVWRQSAKKWRKKRDPTSRIRLRPSRRCRLLMRTTSCCRVGRRNGRILWAELLRRGACPEQ